jgi:type I restriction enzyme M protein
MLPPKSSIIKCVKPLGKKRVEFSYGGTYSLIEKMFLDFEENEYSKIFDNALILATAQITVNRPLRGMKRQYCICKQRQTKADPKLKDTENIPLKEDIQEFFEREVLPFAPDAWWDNKDTKIGYEINFAKYFYKHQPPRALTEIAKGHLCY